MTTKKMSKREMASILKENGLDVSDTGEEAPIVTASVGYEKAEDGYRLYTFSQDAVRALGRKGFILQYNQETSCFTAVVKSLPRVPGVKTYKVEVVYPTEAVQERIERQYNKIEAMNKVMSKMQKSTDKEQEKLYGLLTEHGLKLKPGAPEDAQILLRHLKKRLHQKISIHKSIDREEVERLLKKHPILKQCFVPEVRFDVSVAKGLLPDLPPEVQKRIIQMSTIKGVYEDALRNPECRVCGGGLTKSGSCKRCGFSKGNV